MGDTEVTKVILDINGNDAHKELERQRKMIELLQEDAAKIAETFGTQSKELKDIEAKIHRAQKALKNYESTCVEISEILKKLDIANFKELERASKAFTAQMNNPAMNRGSEEMKQVMTNLSQTRQEMVKAKAETDAFMATIKETGTMSVNELAKADRALKGLMTTQQQNSASWKETGQKIQEIQRELDKATAAQKRFIADANGSVYGKSEAELKRMKEALEATLPTIKMGSAEWKETNTQLTAVNKRMQEIQLNAKEMQNMVWKPIDGKSKDDLVKIKQVLTEHLNSVKQGSDEWNRYNKRIEQVSAAIDKIEVQTKKSSKYALMDPKGLPLVDLNKMESTLKAIIKAEQQGTAEWDRANAKLKEVRDEIYRLDIESKRAAVDVEKVLKNMSSANLSELRKTLEVLNKEINSPNIRRGSEEWNRYNAAIKQVNAEIKMLEAESKETKSWIDRFNDGMNNWQTTIAAGVAALMGLYQQLVEMRNFSFAKEDAASKLQAITGLDDKSIFWLRDRARQLSTEMEDTGMRVRQSTAEIMDAFRLTGSNKPELLKDREGLYEVTKEVIRLSQASTMDLQPATIALTTALNQFGESADAARKYVNALAAGSKYGAADVENQTKVIVRSGVAARLAGLGFEDLVAATETLAETGLKGERAGTSMKTVLTRMELGAKDCRPSIVGLDQALENMASRANDVEWLKKTFGLWSFSAAKTLIEHRESLKKYRKAVTDTNVAEEQAIIMGKNSVAIHTQLVNKFKEMSDDLYEMVGPAILHVTSKMVNWTRTVKEIMKWILDNKEMLAALALQWAAVTAVINANVIAEKIWLTWNVTIVESIKKIKVALVSLKASGGIWVILANLVATAGIAISHYMNKVDEAKKKEEEFEKARQQRIEESQRNNEMLAARYRVWEEMLHREDIAYKEKLKILARLNKAVPEYQGVIDKATGAVKGNVQALDEWLKKQNAIAVMNAYMEEYTQAQIRLTKARKAHTKAYHEEYVARTKLQFSNNPSGNTTVNHRTSAGVFVQTIRTDEGKNWDNARKAVEETDKELKVAEADVNRLNELIGETIKEAEKLGANFTLDAAHDNEINNVKNEAEQLKKSQIAEAANREKQEARIVAEGEKKKWAERLKAGKIGQEEYKQKIGLIDIDLLDQYITIMEKYYKKDSSQYLDAVADKEQAERKFLEDTVKAEEKAINEIEKEEKKEIKDKLIAIEAEKKRRIAEAIERKNAALKDGKEKEAVEIRYNQVVNDIELDAFSQKMDLYEKDSEKYKYYEALKLQAAAEYMNKIQEKVVGIQDRLFAKEASKVQNEIIMFNEGLRLKIISQEQYNEAMKLLRREETNAMYSDQKKQNKLLNLGYGKRMEELKTIYQNRQEELKKQLEEGKLTQEQYAIEIKQLRIKHNDETYKEFQSTMSEWLGKYKAIISQVQNMLSSYSSMVDAEYQAQISAVENRYDIEIEKAKKAGRDTTKMEAEKARAVTEIQLQQIKAKHDSDVAQALMNVALAITESYAQYPFYVALALSPLLTAMGAMQVSTLNTQYSAQKKSLETQRSINSQFYSGGYTNGNRYHREAGIVHEGEFVANHQAVNNPYIRPMLDLIDYAQRNNRVARLTDEDLAMANSYRMGGFAKGGYTSAPSITVNPPSVNVNYSEELRKAIDLLNAQLAEGIHADVSITGRNGIEQKEKRYRQIIANKSRTL